MKQLTDKEKEQQLQENSIIFYNTAIMECQKEILEAIAKLNTTIGMDVHDVELEFFEYPDRKSCVGIKLIFKK